MTDEQRTRAAWASLVIGPIAAVLVAWASESARADLPIANVALVLGILSTCAALAGWKGGLVTSIAAGLSLNYFHTEPTHSLRMRDGGEVVTVLLLVALGAVVSVATAVRVRRHALSARVSHGADAQEELRHLLAGGGPALAAWHAALDGANPQLGLVDAQLAASEPEGLPLIGRRSTPGQMFGDDSGDVVVLPEAGAVVRLADSGTCLVVRPRTGIGALAVPRQALFGLADQVARSL